jgi:tetratricopeptide (TPR) repeat protein
MLEARQLLQQVGNQPLLADNYHGYAILSNYAGDFTAAYQSAQQAIELAKELNNLYSWNNGSWFIAICLLEQGNYGEALALFEELLVRRIGPVQFYIGILTYFLHAHITIGLIDERAVEPFIAQTEEALQSGPFFRTWYVGQLVRLHVARADLAAAVEAFDRYGFKLDTTPFSSTASSLFLADVQLAFAQGNMVQAQQKVTQIIKMFELVGQRLWLLDLLLIKAKIQHTVGQNRASKNTLLHALEIADPSERRVRWQLLSKLAELDRADGQIEEAEKRQAQAQEVINYILAGLDKAEWRDAFLRRTQL